MSIHIGTYGWVIVDMETRQVRGAVLRHGDGTVTRSKWVFDSREEAESELMRMAEHGVHVDGLDSAPTKDPKFAVFHANVNVVLDQDNEPPSIVELSKKVLP
jgi:hypothetical protein